MSMTSGESIDSRGERTTTEVVDYSHEESEDGHDARGKSNELSFKCLRCLLEAPLHHGR